ncbi:MAG: polysaccharide deacetylase family protein [Saprospirales bacterium]|nr:polysaccharide deacetylase family protein [Saprospirales bacterium]
MSALRNLVFKAIRYSGLPFLFREMWQRKQVTIVMLHDPAPGAAEAAFLYLAKKYNIIGLDDYLEARRNNRKLPPKALIITLDDGHAGNRALLPVLEKHKIPVTIFLCAGIVGTNRRFWFKHKDPAIRTEALKQVSNREKLEHLAAAGFWPEREFPTPQALDAGQIGDLSPCVNFQSHTVFHPCLPKCTYAEARCEIFQSKQLLEQQYGLRINALAYPNGDYSDRDASLAKAAGYACAITVDYGFNNLKTDPYRLKRLSIDDTDQVDAVCVKAAGVWTLLMNLAGKRRRSGRMDPVPPGMEQKKEPLGQIASLWLLTALYLTTYSTGIMYPTWA